MEDIAVTFLFYSQSSLPFRYFGLSFWLFGTVQWYKKKKGIASIYMDGTWWTAMDKMA